MAIIPLLLCWNGDLDKTERLMLRFQCIRSTNSLIICVKHISKQITRLAQTNLFADITQIIREKYF